MLSKASEEKKEIIILGDMNVNFLAPGDSKDLKSIFDVFGFKQMLEKPTRIITTTETLIDVFLTNNPANISKADVVPICIGDHDMPGCVRKINNAYFKSRLITCRDYKRYNAENMKADLKSVGWSPLYEHTNVKRAWAFMRNVLSHIFECHAPVIVKKIRGKPAPWLSNDVQIK